MFTKQYRTELYPHHCFSRRGNTKLACTSAIAILFIYAQHYIQASDIFVICSIFSLSYFLAWPRYTHAEKCAQNLLVNMKLLKPPVLIVGFFIYFAFKL